ncbi:predicted protein [Plenodomus lingam JN3]|uniref:Predicted protein n=1 Tax=Leptosphaeria maculans (strain JN3 / isolate v23.1.3 / race Av1-4-5-6-7-8) TaxID=985895 RepID=E5A1U7_LEPMJ|nr:predicted protein [Plenodomus lingam JN3]CBX97664.1 predicted protein [Plenodomus lingam JN3]
MYACMQVGRQRFAESRQARSWTSRLRLAGEGGAARISSPASQPASKEESGKEESRKERVQDFGRPPEPGLLCCLRWEPSSQFMLSTPPPLLTAQQSVMRTPPTALAAVCCPWNDAR